MGDGQHAWASAEWVTIIRNAFVREEEGTLVLGGGIPDAWLADGAWRFGPTPTSFGPIEVELVAEGSSVRVSWRGRWRSQTPAIRVDRPGGGSAMANLGGSGRGSLTLASGPLRTPSVSNPATHASRGDAR